MKKLNAFTLCILGSLIAIVPTASLADSSIITGVNYGSCPLIETCDDLKHPYLIHHHCFTNTTQTTYKGTTTLVIQGSALHFPISVKPGITDFYDCAHAPGPKTPVNVEYDFGTFKLKENFDLLDDEPFSVPFVGHLTIPTH